MNPESSSLEANTNRRIDALCGIIDYFTQSYLDGPREDKKFFLGSAPEGEAELRHLELHKLHYKLLEECKVLGCGLYNLGGSAHASYVTFNLIQQYHDVFKNSTPVQFICEEANCKIFSKHAIRAVEYMRFVGTNL